MRSALPTQTMILQHPCQWRGVKTSLSWKMRLQTYLLHWGNHCEIRNAGGCKRSFQLRWEGRGGGRGGITNPDLRSRAFVGLLWYFAAVYTIALCNLIFSLIH